MPGVVSDAVPSLSHGVICDLSFNVAGLPIEDGIMVAHSPMVCQFPGGFFCASALGTPPDLVKVHAHLDALVDKAYGLSPSAP